MEAKIHDCLTFFLQALEPHVTVIDVRLYMLMLLLPLILINWVRNLKFLAPFSTFANAITFASFGMILYYLFREPLDFEDKAAVGKIENFPLFFGTVLFALEAIGVVRTIVQFIRIMNPFIYIYIYTKLNVLFTRRFCHWRTK